jgi:hypothetical protein
VQLVVAYQAGLGVRHVLQLEVVGEIAEREDAGHIRRRRCGW